MKSFHPIRLYAVEKLTLIYIFITFIISVFFIFNNYPVQNLLLIRIILIPLIIVSAYFTSFSKNKIVPIFRFALIGGLLLYLYPETFTFNRYLLNNDSIIAQCEQSIFHCQPSILFAKRFPQQIIAELMNMGYFSLYLLIAFTSVFFFIKNRKFFHQFFFITIFAFFSYYIIFILFPVTGPQYYFKIISEKQALSGIFPSIGYYFSQHYIEPSNVTSGFFNGLVNFAQMIGERPTGAFPSSHIGISTLIMFMVIKDKKYLLSFIIFPFYFFLVLSTVYIQAHYLVDVIAGFFSAFILFYTGRFTYRYLAKED